MLPNVELCSITQDLSHGKARFLWISAIVWGQVLSMPLPGRQVHLLLVTRIHTEVALPFLDIRSFQVLGGRLLSGYCNEGEAHLTPCQKPLGTLLLSSAYSVAQLYGKPVAEHYGTLRSGSPQHTVIESYSHHIPMIHTDTHTHLYIYIHMYMYIYIYIHS